MTFDQNDPQQGVFLVPDSSPEPDQAIRMTHFSQKPSGQIVFRVPDGLAPRLLPAGSSGRIWCERFADRHL